MSTSERYSHPAIALHWLMALLILGSFAIGLTMTDLPVSPLRLKLYNWHKWAGVTVLLLGLVRLAWRCLHRPPADIAMPAWQRRAAHAVHIALYALFIATPLAGWAYSSAAGFPIVWLGLVPLPDFVPVDRALADTLKLLHKVLVFLMATAVTVHIAAALKHRFVDRDGLLQRMWPGRA
jgi:cytochrome b561